MESQKNSGERGGASGSAVTGGIPLVPVSAIFGQRPSIPLAPFFHGFPRPRNQLLFLYSHSYMPPILGFGFSAPAQGTPTATIDLTGGSPKRCPQDTVIDHSMSTKKRRAPRKK